jgi:hypothetical protein
MYSLEEISISLEMLLIIHTLLLVEALSVEHKNLGIYKIIGIR